MKFPQLPMGQRFAFQGKNYTKTGPLTASDEETGNNRLMKKSAEILPLGLIEEQQTEEGTQFTRQEVLEMFSQYRSDLQNAVLAEATEQASLSLNEIVKLIERQAFAFEKS